MSIIIKGMDMPKPDTFNNIIIHSNGQVAMPFWGKGMQAVEGIEAQQLPPHGRLIDADALIKEWESGFYRRIVEALMEDAPTIIEAEEEE